MVKLLSDSRSFIYIYISVFQNKIWISSNIGRLAVGQIKTYFQDRTFTDPTFGNNVARFHGDQMGDCGYGKVICKLTSSCKAPSQAQSEICIGVCPPKYNHPPPTATLISKLRNLKLKAEIAETPSGYFM